MMEDNGGIRSVNEHRFVNYTSRTIHIPRLQVKNFVERRRAV